MNRAPFVLFKRRSRSSNRTCGILVLSSVLLVMSGTDGISQDPGAIADALVEKWVAERNKELDDLQRQIDLAETQGKQNGRKRAPQDDRAEPPSPSTGQAALQEIVRNMSLKFARLKRYGAPLGNSIGMLFVPIPAGRFTTRPPEVSTELRAPWRTRGENPVEVTLTKPFHLGAHEVTEAQYRRLGFSSNAPFEGVNAFGAQTTFRNGDPAHYVSWDSAVAFCAELTELPEEKAAGRTYRLPTEAEWEYACRAGTTSPFYFGSDVNLARDSANWRVVPRNEFIDTARSWTVVGSYPPNSFGLFDMYGNVEEWCSDWYGPYPGGQGQLVDPVGPATGTTRVVRGGSFEHYYLNATSGTRDSIAPSDRRITVGFRVVCEVRTAIGRETKQ